jgi:hypothetical protein
MKMFSKISKSDSTPETVPGAKRDVSIVHKATKRPDHVLAETHDSTWKIPLTLDEQYTLGQAYERGTDNEQQMLSEFTESIYQGGAATQITVEMNLVRPGEVFLKASSRHRFNRSNTVRYEDIGRTVCEWIAEAQTRKELVADLVAALEAD